MIEMVDVRLDHPRGGEPLVSGANLKVARGEVVMIVGAAGVGTSRMVAAALGEWPASSGRIEVMGRDVSKLRRASLRLMRRRVGIVPQDLCLLDDRSAQLNVCLPLEIDGIPRSVSIVRAGEVLGAMRLTSEASLPVECLSAAEKQRVAVARALVRSPDIVIADHPTSMQDAAGAELVCTALAAAAARGAAVIVLGRDPALRMMAEKLGWTMYVLVEGKLRAMAELGSAVEEVLASVDSVQIAPAAEAPSASEELGDVGVEPDSQDNVVPFPLSARTAGVA
jgi:cell division transport system ATP-binding protein